MFVIVLEDFDVFHSEDMISSSESAGQGQLLKNELTNSFHTGKVKTLASMLHFNVYL